MGNAVGLKKNDHEMSKNDDHDTVREESANGEIDYKKTSGFAAAMSKKKWSTVRVRKEEFNSGTKILFTRIYSP